MNYLRLFDDFDRSHETYQFDGANTIDSKLNQMFSLTENNSKVSFSFQDFKSLFTCQIFENAGLSIDDSLMEKAYFDYEMGMLYESRKNWFDPDNDLFEFSKGVISYLQSEDGHYFLFKNNEAFIISEMSMRMLQEGFWGDVVNWTKKNVYEPIKSKVIEPIKNKAIDLFSSLSKGAKKVWDFSKKILSAVTTFLKENWADILFYLSVILQVVGGIVAFIPAAGQVVGPVLLIIAGMIQIGLGGYDVYSGCKKLEKCPMDPIETGASEFIQGLGKLLSGTISFLLGIYEVSTSAKAAIPSAGVADAAVSTSAKTWVSTTVKSLKTTKKYTGIFKTCVEWLAENGSKAALSALGKSGEAQAGIVSVTAKGTGKALGRFIGSDVNKFIIPIICIALSYGMSWMDEIIVKAVSGLGGIFEKITNSPKSLSDAITKFEQTHSGSWIGRTLSSALTGFVKPASDVLAKFVEIKIKPLVSPITTWMKDLPKAKDFTTKRISKEEQLLATLKGNPIRNPGTPKTEPIPVKITQQDIASMDALDASKTNKNITKEFAKEGGGLEFYKDSEAYSKEKRSQVRQNKKDDPSWKKSTKKSKELLAQAKESLNQFVNIKSRYNFDGA
jgi:hypothetical protein